MKIVKQIYSINFDKFQRSEKRIIYVIFHYTGMVSEIRAIERLASESSKVSCHYFIKRDGTIINMVPDKFVAWHAGMSCWKNHKNLNNRSIGIEIQNSGLVNKNESFSVKQIKSLLSLSKILKRKYKIKSKNFLGHSDIAPSRKKDPGKKFPWKYLAKNKIGVWYNLPKKNLKTGDLKVSKKNQKLFSLYLKKIGYCLMSEKANYLGYVIKAFQRRFRSKKINGKIDNECFEIAKNLIKSGLN